MGSQGFSDADFSWWMDRKVPVTPDDIQRAQQEAIDDGADPTELKRLLMVAVLEAGGTVEALAQRWTERNRLRLALAEFGTAIRRRETAKHTAPIGSEAMLRDLIRQYPDVARSVLGDDESEEAS
ncbi:hypothetical protein FXF51_42715 [Nonomuraea sp. PA05]|uniref:hypothetical protein n=1 Tax=Nonomuraea sp. PA05 TaxID=2604466 RepID=UPI0011D38D04|nr:hypothetical protein [Nonomuraea sp. PA05]TYB56822.1 hypothetical protein FXF51_42715 [Nonomuraea sp. PA05]